MLWLTWYKLKDDPLGKISLFEAIKLCVYVLRPLQIARRFDDISNRLGVVSINLCNQAWHGCLTDRSIHERDLLALRDLITGI